MSPPVIQLSTEPGSDAGRWRRPPYGVGLGDGEGSGVGLGWWCLDGDGDGDGAVSVDAEGEGEGEGGGAAVGAGARFGGGGEVGAGLGVRVGEGDGDGEGDGEGDVDGVENGASGGADCIGPRSTPHSDPSQRRLWTISSRHASQPWPPGTVSVRIAAHPMADSWVTK